MDEETCDHCGPSVRAYVWVQIGDSYLTYCGSCSKRYWTRLVEVAGGTQNIIDLRHMIA